MVIPGTGKEIATELMFENGYSVASLSRILSLSRSTISRILSGKKTTKANKWKLMALYIVVQVQKQRNPQEVIMNTPCLIEKKRTYLGDQYPGIYLTEREMQCVSLFLEGKTTVQVAEIYGLSVRTVEYYTENTKKKLDCQSKKQLLEKLHPMYDPKSGSWGRSGMANRKSKK